MLTRRIIPGNHCAPQETGQSDAVLFAVDSQVEDTCDFFLIIQLRECKRHTTIEKIGSKSSKKRLNIN